MNQKNSTIKTKPTAYLITFIALGAASITPLFFGNEWAKEYGYMVLLAYSLIGTTALAKNKNNVAFVSPASIIFLYLSWSMTIGAWGHSIAAVLPTQQYVNFLTLQRTDEALALFMLTLAILTPLGRPSSNLKDLTCKAINFPEQPLYLLIILLTPFIFISIDLSAFGGSGTIDNVVRALLSISGIVLLSNMRKGSRHFYYFLVLALNSSVSSFNKREAIFLIFVIFFLEAYNGKIKINFSQITKGAISLVAIVVLIIAMSITRGYGDYEVNTFLSSFLFLLDYISSDMFISMFLNNIEVNYIYFHAVNSIEAVLSNKVDIELGATFIKFLFLPFPREIVTWKPDSAIHLYTMYYDPSIRDMGGSWPINIISELIWNFWLLAPVGATVLAWIFFRLEIALVTTRLGKRSLMMVFYLFLYMNTIALARGSGFDLYVFELLIAFFITTLLRITLSLLETSSLSIAKIK